MNTRRFGIFENAEVLEVLEQGKPSGLTTKGLRLIMGNEANRKERYRKQKGLKVTDRRSGPQILFSSIGKRG